MTATTVNIHDAKTNLSRLLDRVAAGETIIIAKAGKPKAVLSPLPQSAPRRPGRFAGHIQIHDSCFAPMSEEELLEMEEGYPGDPMLFVTKPQPPLGS